MKNQLHIFLHIICNQTYFKSLLLPWKIALARVMRSIFVALMLCHRCLFYPGQIIFNDITIYYNITYITSTTTYLAYIKQPSPRKLRECSDWLSTSICSICDDRNKLVMTIDVSNFQWNWNNFDNSIKNFV